MQPISATVRKSTGVSDRPINEVKVKVVAFIDSVSEDRSRAYGNNKGLHGVCILTDGSVTQFPAFMITVDIEGEETDAD
jgi:hypothetical protein